METKTENRLIVGVVAVIMTVLLALTFTKLYHTGTCQENAAKFVNDSWCQDCQQTVIGTNDVCKETWIRTGNENLERCFSEDDGVSWRCTTWTSNFKRE